MRLTLLTNALAAFVLVLAVAACDSSSGGDGGQDTAGGNGDGQDVITADGGGGGEDVVAGEDSGSVEFDVPMVDPDAEDPGPVDTAQPPDAIAPDEDVPVVCEGSCDGRECGDDGCGNPCGDCSGGLTCAAGQCVPPIADDCAYSGFPPVESYAIVDSESGRTRFFARDIVPEFGEKDGRSLTIWNRVGEPLNGPTEAGTYDLGEQTNLADCNLCLLARKNCNMNGMCETYFMPREGTLQIEAFGGAGEPFTGTLDVVMVEVEIDPQTLATTPVEGGEVWCAQGFEIDEIVLSDEPRDECFAPGTGTAPGDNVADFTLANCYGDPVSLHDFCGEEKAIWMIVVAGWCSACETYLPQAAAGASAWRELGDRVRLIAMLGEDEYGNKPTQQFCENYAVAHDMDPADVLIDPYYQTTFSRIDNYADNVISLPFEALLDGDNMRYHFYSWSGASGNVSAEITELLND